MSEYLVFRQHTAIANKWLFPEIPTFSIHAKDPFDWQQSLDSIQDTTEHIKSSKLF